MSSSIVTKSDSDCESSSPTSYCHDDVNVRRVMNKLLSWDNNKDPSSLVVNDNDVRSSVSSSLVLHPSLSYKNNHAKLTSN
jgi:hypothetical protein